jgi:hypothetical protein
MKECIPSLPVLVKTLCWLCKTHISESKGNALHSQHVASPSTTFSSVSSPASASTQLPDLPKKSLGEFLVGWPSDEVTWEDFFTRSAMCLGVKDMKPEI